MSIIPQFKRKEREDKRVQRKNSQDLINQTWEVRGNYQGD